jgi:type II secretory pathway component GspD/PulD (secretin)
MKWLSAILLLFVSLATFAEEKPKPVSKQDQKLAAEEFKRALELRKEGKVDEALLAATDASRLVPADSEYLLTREMLRQQIVSSYLNRGNKLAEDGDTKAAATQFKEALARDPENSYAQQRLHDVSGDDSDHQKVMQLLAGVNNVELMPASGKRNIHAGPDMRSVYTQIGQAFGVTFDFDQTVTNRQIRIDLDNVDFDTVTSFLGQITKTFWAPVSSKEAIVANDTQDMRTAYERMAVRTFYVPNVSGSSDLNDLANVMRVIFDMKFISVQASQNTITVRAPHKEIEAMTSFIDSIMDAKPEIMLVVNEYEFDADKLRQYGLNLPTDFTIFNIPSEIRRVLGSDAQTVIDQLNQNGTIDPTKISPTTLGNLAGSPLLLPFVFFGKGLGLTGVVVPSISGQLSSTSSFAANLEHVNMRAMDGEASMFRVGTKFPVLSSSFNAVALNSRGQTSLGITPQFQYVDLGLTLKITPHYQSGGDIKLDMDLEIEGLGAQSFNNVPELTSRSFKGNITVREGDPSVIGGSITDQEQRSTQGYPGLGQLPGISAVLNTHSKDHTHNEILFVVTPYVIRKPFHDRGANAIWNLK